MKHGGARTRNVARPGGWRIARDVTRVPGLISLTRLPLALAFLATHGHPWWGVAVLALAGASDVLDGWYARRFHEQTSAGAMLDGVMDKVFVMASLAALLATGRLGPLEAMALCVRELAEVPLLLRVGLSSRRRAEPHRRAANRTGKVATSLQFVALVVVLFVPRGHILRVTVVAVTGVASAASAIAYVWRERRFAAPTRGDRDGRSDDIVHAPR